MLWITAEICKMCWFFQPNFKLQFIIAFCPISIEKQMNVFKSNLSWIYDAAKKYIFCKQIIIAFIYKISVLLKSSKLTIFELKEPLVLLEKCKLFFPNPKWISFSPWKVFQSPSNVPQFFPPAKEKAVFLLFRNVQIDDWRKMLR